MMFSPIDLFYLLFAGALVCEVAGLNRRRS